MEYNVIKRVKKRIDNLLLKSLEFKNGVGQKVKVMEIPVLERNSPNYMLIQFRLQLFITTLYKKEKAKSCYSFRDHLKRVLKWPVYEEIFKAEELKSNA